MDEPTILKMDCRAGLGTFQLELLLNLKSAFTALFGPSGCGKTSTLKLIAGLLSPTSGSIALNGQTVFDSEKKIDVQPEHREIGLVFQDGRLFPHFTVKQNLEFGLKTTPVEKRKLRIHDVVDLLKMARLLARKPASLSGGEIQRVAIGRALLTSPGLLLMDEPLAAVDLPAKLAILAELQKIHDTFALPIIYVSHDIGTVLNIASHVVLMGFGEVIAEGLPYDVLAEYVTRPMMSSEEIRNILEIEIMAHDNEKGTTEVRTQNTSFTLPRLPDGVGAKLHIDIPASEIILAIEKPKGLSARNILSGHVVEICHLGGRVILRVDVGIVLSVEIVEGTLKGLNLKVGRDVYLVMKATSFRRVG